MAHFPPNILFLRKFFFYELGHYFFQNWIVSCFFMSGSFSHFRRLYGCLILLTFTSFELWWFLSHWIPYLLILIIYCNNLHGWHLCGYLLLNIFCQPHVMVSKCRLKVLVLCISFKYVLKVWCICLCKFLYFLFSQFLEMSFRCGSVVIHSAIVIVLYDFFLYFLSELVVCFYSD